MEFTVEMSCSLAQSGEEEYGVCLQSNTKTNCGFKSGNAKQREKLSAGFCDFFFSLLEPVGELSGADLAPSVL